MKAGDTIRGDVVEQPLAMAVHRQLGDLRLRTGHAVLQRGCCVQRWQVAGRGRQSRLLAWVRVRVRVRVYLSR